jgi:hypothetical protein
MPSLTYAELAEALKITPASANKLARRRRWPRVPGNDGKAKVSVPEEALVRRDVPQDSPPPSPLDVPPVSSQDSPPDKLIKALEAHVETLKAQLAAAEARLDKQAEDLVAYDAAYAAGLTAERAKVEAERAKAERVVAEFAATLKAEQAQTEKAIAAFASLAERLDALAAARSRPWWRRLAG